MVGCAECPNGDGKQVKVVLTFGLVALVVFAALLVVVGQRVAPRIEAGLGLEPRQSYTPGGVSYDDGKSASLNQMPVNEQAAREVKKQTGNQPAVQPVQPGQPSSLTSTPTAPRYSVSVFVGTDPLSQDMLNWWNTNANLQALKIQSNWQAYTKDNQLYRERYASLVPVTDFPAVVFSDPRGGHVYASSAQSLPRSAEELYAEIYAAYQTHQQVVQQPTDPTPITGDAASSSARPDCPDGNCFPADRQPFLDSRPGIFPLLKPRQKDPIESILYWLWNPGEALLAMLCAIVFLALLGVVLLKVVRQS
jgi:hypothetical protein